MQDTDAGSSRETVEDIDAADLLELGHPALPPFLQTASLAIEVIQNPDEAAEQVAVSPGPLGEAVPVETWFESTVVGSLLEAWKVHAEQVDASVRSSVTVRDSQHHRGNVHVIWASAALVLMRAPLFISAPACPCFNGTTRVTRLGHTSVVLGPRAAARSHTATTGQMGSNFWLAYRQYKCSIIKRWRRWGKYVNLILRGCEKLHAPLQKAANRACSTSSSVSSALGKCGMQGTIQG